MTDLAINFDTTGSMNPVRKIVAQKVEQLLTDAFKEIPDLRVAIGVNGDYGDLSYSGYDTKNTQLTTDIFKLTKFIREAKETYGFGNGGECYELVLNRMRSLNWSNDRSQKFLVMISDEPPHIPTWHENKHHLDWRVESKALGDQGVAIITVQCLSRYEGDRSGYYRDAALLSNGYALKLDQFGEIIDVIKAIMARSQGLEPLEDYEKTVVAAGRMNRTLGKSFDVLAGRSTPIYDNKYGVVPTSGDLVPVPAGRFQILDIGPSDVVIKDFVTSNGLPFKTGRGFYQFTKREEIQEYKEVVLREKGSGDMYSGDQAKRLIGLTPGVRQNLTPSTGTDKYDIFIQSTSYNRKLKANQKFLYEVDLSL